MAGFRKILLDGDDIDVGVITAANNINLTKGTSANIDGNDEIAVPTVSWLYLTSAGATDNLDGIGAGVEGQLVFLTVVAGKDITLVHDGTVTAGKKLMINGEANVTLDEDHDLAIAVYDATATVWNVLVPGSGGGGDVATDAIWDAKGDLAGGTGANTAARLAVGTNNFVLTADSGETTGMKWAASGGGGGGSPNIILLAGSGKPRISDGCAEPALVESSTNKVNYWVLDFDEGSDEYACWGPIAMPTDYDGGVLNATFYWTTTATDTDGVAWAIQLLSLDDNDAIDTAWGSAVVTTDAAQSAAGELLVTAVSGDITPGGTATAPEMLYVQIFRDVSDGADGMVEDARLISVKLTYTAS